MSKVKTMLQIAGGGTLLCAIIAVFIVATQSQDTDLEALEREGRIYMEQVNKEGAVTNRNNAEGVWDYVTNITKENNDRNLKIQVEGSNWYKKIWEEIKTYRWQEFQDYTLRRMFQKYSVIGTDALPQVKNEQLLKILTYMKANYAGAQVCSYKEPTKCDLRLDPDISGVFSTSQDPEELKYYWLEWHRVGGAAVKDNYTEYVTLSNEGAKLNNFSNLAEMWQADYEVNDFEEQLANLWNDIKPLYLQIHAYVRKRLRDKYGEEVVTAKGPIPAHLLGDIWASFWGSINSFTIPYPDKKGEDITAAMVKQNYTALKMFQMADEFYQSLNLTAMPDLFYNKSIFEKPTDREIDCEASSWDFHDGKDFRIKQCTLVTYDFLQSCYHEMGHIEYYLQYSFQPDIFRGGANPGFQEAVGDTIGFSVSSQKFLKRNGLSNIETEDEQTEINQLFQTAMEKVVFLPFAYMLELFRYGVFRGTTTPQDYNCHYWRLRESLQGVEPPAPRTEKDFDAAAKYHVSAGVEYARYYVAYIIQFQFQRTLCELAGEFVADDPTKKLVNCDIYQSATAGNAFANMLKLGSSRPWPDAMEALTGQRQMKADGVLEYFKPLQDWLTAENKRTGEFIGWEDSKIQFCTPEQIAALNNTTSRKIKPRKLKLRRT